MKFSAREIFRPLGEKLTKAELQRMALLRWTETERELTNFLSIDRNNSPRFDLNLLKNSLHLEFHLPKFRSRSCTLQMFALSMSFKFFLQTMQSFHMHEIALSKCVHWLCNFQPFLETIQSFHLPEIASHSPMYTLYVI